MARYTSRPSLRRSPSPEVVFRTIRADRTRGARALSTEAMRALAVLSADWPGLPDAALRQMYLRIGRTLERSQPAMGCFLRWAGEWRRFGRQQPRPPSVRWIGAWIRRQRRLLATELRGIVRTSRRRFPPARTALTLSRSESVLTVLRETGVRRTLRQVWVAESLPGGEGRLFCADLRRAGLPARLILDRCAPEVVSRSDLLIIGADAVFSDGSVVHKVGTRALAAAASHARVPVVVVAGDSKFTGRPAPRRRLPARFDRTPARLVTEFWTDRGTRPGGGDRRSHRRGPLL